MSRDYVRFFLRSDILRLRDKLSAREAALVVVVLAAVVVEAADVVAVMDEIDALL